MKNHQKVAVLLSATVVSLLLATPSYGLVISDFFSSIVDDIKGEVSQIQTWTKSQIDQSWAGIKKDAQAAIDNTVGEMGAPDPIASSDELKNRIADTYSLPVAKEKGEDLERELTKASITSVIGITGQADTSQKIEKTTQIAQDAKSIADQAQEMNASQNILKAIAAQNGLVVSMLAQQRTDSLQARQDNSYSNLMLTQVAENTANARKKQDLNELGTLSLTHELIGISRLDPTQEN
ncbi:Methyl-accepting chemotaxis protein (plasmid) [Nostoc flagelliforme CCNUN1]|uniref:Methyl-accepting chemotaxis protein n=1 Tax=Nostoc flagelliforme CCNUN1 TaxID=2038116 RepID=A0A2K8TAJ9_9NOSO|nr:hypothetical protein [Nostoc flagelliforme]AUB44613.1 Methyl-accepting chemotaxis protein [Nostoc flagelliforme CCNUN1]